jgi:energy-coupling factor transport system ATP-binding protein
MALIGARQWGGSALTAEERYMQDILSISGSDDAGNGWWVQIRPGSLVSIHGLRNSLATSLLKVIASRGSSVGKQFESIKISAGGQPISNISADKYLQLVSYLPDDPDVFFANLYVDEEIGFYLENIATPTSEIQDRVQETAGLLGISHLLSRTIASLSGGQKQLVAIAATLCANTKVVLLDDPLANLDAENREAVLGVLKKHCSAGKTVIFADLDWSEWNVRSDHLVIFDKTRPVYDGPSISREKAFQLDVINRGDNGAQTIKHPDTDHRTTGDPLTKLGRTLVVDGVTFSYRNQPTVICEASFELTLDGIIGIVGRNGAGKTTFAKMLAGLLPPSRGYINFRNFGVGDSGIRVAYAFQNPKLQFLADTVKDEIGFLYRFGRKNSKAQVRSVDQLVSEFGLLDVSDRHPLQIPPLHQRKLILAALMAISPHVLIIDEPTNGLDPFEKEDVANQIRAIHMRGTVTFVISHDRRTLASIADHVLLIENQKLSYTNRI